MKPNRVRKSIFLELLAPDLSGGSDCWMTRAKSGSSYLQKGEIEKDVQDINVAVVTAATSVS